MHLPTQAQGPYTVSLRQPEGMVLPYASALLLERYMSIVPHECVSSRLALSPLVLIPLVLIFYTVDKTPRGGAGGKRLSCCTVSLYRCTNNSKPPRYRTPVIFLLDSWTTVVLPPGCGMHRKYTVQAATADILLIPSRTRPSSTSSPTTPLGVIFLFPSLPFPSLPFPSLPWRDQARRPPRTRMDPILANTRWPPPVEVRERDRTEQRSAYTLEHSFLALE